MSPASPSPADAVLPGAPPIVTETGPRPDAAVIWLHGLGADGSDFAPIVPLLRLPMPVRFVFPNAPIRPITINGGMRMPGWYDIRSLGGRDQDEAGIRAAQADLSALVAGQRQAGIAASRIVLAGFSQGGAIALQAGLRHPERLAGIMALSTYLPLAGSLAAERSPANADTPILMVHGLHDEMIPIAMARASRQTLQAHGFAVHWQEFPMGHEVQPDEIALIARWLARVLPPLA